MLSTLPSLMSGVRNEYMIRNERWVYNNGFNNPVWSEWLLGPHPLPNPAKCGHVSH